MSDYAVAAPNPLPVGSLRHKGLGWWGVGCLIVTEGALFVFLLFSYYYFALQLPTTWLPSVHPSLALALPNTVILIASSFAMLWGDHGIRHGMRHRLSIGLGIAFVLGVIFLAVQSFEWHSKNFSISSNTFGSLYFLTTGFHMAHVLVGVILIAFAFIWSLMGYFNRERNSHILIISAYWHFVDIVWLFIFSTYYLTPYLGW